MKPIFRYARMARGPRRIIPIARFGPQSLHYHSMGKRGSWTAVRARAVFKTTRQSQVAVERARIFFTFTWWYARVYKRGVAAGIQTSACSSRRMPRESDHLPTSTRPASFPPLWRRALRNEPPIRTPPVPPRCLFILDRRAERNSRATRTLTTLRFQAWHSTRLNAIPTTDKRLADFPPALLLYSTRRSSGSENISSPCRSTRSKHVSLIRG